MGVIKLFDLEKNGMVNAMPGDIVKGVYIVHHDISFSDLLKSADGTIDCKQEQVNSLTFRNQGQSVLVINGSTRLAPGESKEYSTQDESNITNSFDWHFDSTIPGLQNAMVLTRGKRIASYVTIATIR